MKYSREFDLYVDIVIIVYKFFAKILFFFFLFLRPMGEDRQNRDGQGDITNK